MSLKDQKWMDYLSGKWSPENIILKINTPRYQKCTESGITNKKTIVGKSSIYKL